MSPTSKFCHQHPKIVTNITGDILGIHFEIFSVDFLTENCHLIKILIRGHKKSLTDFESFKRVLEDELFVAHLNKESWFKNFSKTLEKLTSTFQNRTRIKTVIWTENLICHWINEFFIFIQDLIFNWSSAFGVSEKC